MGDVIKFPPNTPRTIRDVLAEVDPHLQLLEGYDDCIVGVVTGAGRSPAVCYDRDQIIRKIIDNSDYETEDDAYMGACEHFDFNIAGAYVGDNTPVFITSIEKLEP